MSYTDEELVDALDSVISIPPVPFQEGAIDLDGHAKNVDYLMANNELSGGRPRVISIAGTSLIHHITPEDQVRVIDMTGRQMGTDGVLIAALLPNPIGTAGELIERFEALDRRPDAYLLMPLGGTYSPEGLRATLHQFADEYGSRYGARFLYYYRRKRDMDAIIRLLQDSTHFLGVKIGTEVADVPAFVSAVPETKAVIWGIGDRSTAAAELGSRGHTSGINILVSKASDAINNAQRARDFKSAREIEARIAPLEEIRFVNEREYNYSAVVEAIIASGVTDVVAGSGGPFNPRVPDEVRAKIEAMIPELMAFH